jgi:hypothetical protein
MPALPDITPATIKVLVSKCWIVDYQKRTSLDGCYQFLSAYLYSHSTEFPAIEKLAVSQISGVQRTFTFVEDSADRRNIPKTARRSMNTARDNTDTGKQKSEIKRKRNIGSGGAHRRKGVSKLTDME